MTTKRSILSIFFLLFAFHSFAQILEPVKWSFDSKQNGNEVKLIFKATIEDDWHLYDTSLPDGGPVPTSINFEDTSKFELVGELEKKPKPTEKFDQTFQMDLRYFDGQAELIQTIRLKTDEPLTESPA